MNLERASILLVDGPLGLELLSQVLYGFGARVLHRCRTAGEARSIMGAQALDLIVSEAMLTDGDSYKLIATLRAGSLSDQNRFCPAILLSAHTGSSQVAAARDCGANFFVAKPLSPQVLMDRLLWIARDKRQYLECESYTGPDRRFNIDAPEGSPRRRRNDRAAEPEAEPL